MRGEGGGGHIGLSLTGPSFGVTFCQSVAGISRENITFIMMQNKKIIRIVLATAFILLLPLLAMQITDEVVWDLADFAVAAVLLVGTGLMYELVAKKGGNVAYRAAVGVALAAALLLVWMALAVGILGVEGDPADLMYIGVLAVGLIGAIIVRFQSHGMARALFATATAQSLVAVIALIAGMPHAEISSVSEILGLNGFFVALWVVSALLFRHAARKRNGPGVEPTA